MTLSTSPAVADLVAPVSSERVPPSIARRGKPASTSATGDLDVLVVGGSQARAIWCRPARRPTTYHAAQVVIATGGFQQPYVPALSRDLSPDVVQPHSSQYRNPRQLPPGDVLVVGAGNSGAQIAAEPARAGRSVSLAMGSRLPVWPQRWLGRDVQFGPVLGSCHQPQSSGGERATPGSGG